MARAGWDGLVESLGSYLEAKAAFDLRRRGPVPWVLVPRAWQHRARRGRALGRLRELKEQALLRCREPVSVKSG